MQQNSKQAEDGKKSSYRQKSYKIIATLPEMC